MTSIGRRGLLGFTGDRYVFARNSGNHAAAMMQAGKAGGVLATRAEVAKLDQRLQKEREEAEKMAGEEYAETEASSGLRRIGSIAELRRQAIIDKRIAQTAEVGSGAMMASEVVVLPVPEAEAADNTVPDQQLVGASA